ncbi:MAG: hypothetical protein AUH84_03290 [Thaumarchaeota archaeon 13_1_40CM_4_38_7]|nr:MAG: hypothetical protein AUH84_03290 [Thaumarchaeota archaeon 13_1_40CM_4_38_7]
MTFNLSFWDLALWLAASSLVMLVASELLAPYFGRKTVLIDAKKLRIVAIIFSLASIFTIGVRVLSLTSG